MRLLRKMFPVGTRSLIFGAHCAVLHPVFVYAAWVKLYGWTFDPRIIIACVVHDWGYWGLDGMDSPEGKQHPRLGAAIMHKLFDNPCRMCDGGVLGDIRCGYKWQDFTAYHSRSFAKAEGKAFSKLCVADKLSAALIPWWLYLPMVTLSGEITEYLAESEKHAKDSKALNADELQGMISGDKKRWFLGFQSYMVRWCNDNKDKPNGQVEW